MNYTKASSTTVENAKSVRTTCSSGLNSITDVKGFLQALEADILSPSNEGTRALVLSQTAGRHSRISSELANGLQLKRDPFKLRVNAKNTQETISTESGQVSATSRRKYLVFAELTSSF